MASEAEIIALAERNRRLLDPFKRVMDGWSVEVQHEFQAKISSLSLVATGDLESEWIVKVRADESGVVVAEFAFREYGRMLEMKRINYTGRMLNYDKIHEWVLSKIAAGQIRYSAKAEALKVGYTDPRVVNDLTYRFARARIKTNRKRRQWYNNTKEANIDQLYQRLQDAMAEALLSDLKAVTVSK